MSRNKTNVLSISQWAERYEKRSLASVSKTAYKMMVLRYNKYLRRNDIRNYATITGGEPMGIKISLT